MSRRKTDGEIGFGSDSFLDIIANIVGILIILIVMAGLKVSQLPPPDDEEPVVEAPPEPNIEEPPQPEPTPAPEPVVIAAPEPLPPPTTLTPGLAGVVEMRPRRLVRSETFFTPPRKPKPIPQPVAKPLPIPVDPNIAAELRRLRAEQSDLLRRSRAASQALAEARAALPTLKEERTRVDDELASVTQQARERSAALDKLAAEAAEQKTEVARLQREIEALERKKPLPKSLDHEITPVGHAVSGAEVHFHLARGGVSPVPLEALQAMLKSDIEQNRSWLLRAQTHQGAVGPVGGFRMQYRVSRVQMTAAEQLASRPGMIRIGLEKWVLVPDQNLQTESAEEAVAEGSLFLRTLDAAPRSAAVTFWVYPDSFDLFRNLQQIARRRGFKVAARPLPNGIPISGSPSGTRSSAQ